jgi:hypothetical protein
MTYWTVGFGGVLACLAVVPALAALSGGVAGLVFVIFLFSYPIALVIVTLRLLSFRCPRCGGRFNSGFNAAFQRQCARCRLPAWEPESA